VGDKYNLGTASGSLWVESEGIMLILREPRHTVDVRRKLMMTGELFITQGYPSVRERGRLRDPVRAGLRNGRDRGGEKGPKILCPGLSNQAFRAGGPVGVGACG